MKIKITIALAVLAVFIVVLAAEKPSDSGVLHLNHEKVAAAFAKGGPLIATNNFNVMAGRRVEGGEVEIHDRDTDIFYIVEGTATFVTGGKPIGTRTTAPGEVRGKELIGGQERQLTKGDVIIIPRRVPHWFKKVDSLFLYFVVKVSE